MNSSSPASSATSFPVEMTWNVNQPGRWRRANSSRNFAKKTPTGSATSSTIPTRPSTPQISRVPPLLPFSSGIPDQWLVHQIETVHWSPACPIRAASSANRGVYKWRDGRQNWTP